jgi:predicted acyl esterase
MDSTGAWRFEDAWPPASLPLEFQLGADNKLGSTKAGSVSYQDRGVSMLNSQVGDSEVFLSEPLAAEVHYAGWPLLTFSAKLDMQGTHFAVHLIDVASDGSEKIINRAYLDAQHRQGLERSVPVAMNALLEYKVRFFPQDDVLGAGHRLKLRIGAVDDWIQPDGTMATTTIVIDDQHPATLSLPVIKNEERRFFTPLKVEG